MDHKKYIDLHEKVKEEISHTQNNYMVIDGKEYTLEGEYIGDNYNHKLVPELSHKQLTTYISNNDLYNFEKEHGGYISLFYRLNQSGELSNYLTKPEITRLIFLSTYISFDTNKITYDNGKPIPDKTLAAMLKYKDKPYKEYISKLVAANIIHIDSDNNKYINESICKYGSINIKQLRKDDISYTRLFKHTVREIFNNATVRELSKLSIIYTILPYVNLEYNIVCHNPDEKNKDNVHTMTVQELCDRLEYKDCTKFRRSLYNLKVKGEYVFGFFLNGNDKRAMKVIINPRLFYAGKMDYLKVLLMFFDVNNKDNNMITD